MPDMNPLDEAWCRYFRTAEMAARRRNRLFFPIMAVGFTVWCTQIIGFGTFNGVALLGLILIVLPSVAVAVDSFKIDRALSEVSEEIELEAFLDFVRPERREQ